MRLDEVVAGIVPAEATVPLCVRGDLPAKAADLERRLRGVDPASTEAIHLAQALEVVREEAEEHTIDVRLRSIGRQAWTDLLADHPPSDDDRALGLDHNPETFPYAALAASMVEPEAATPESIHALAVAVTVGDWTDLWAACVMLHLGKVSVPKSVRATAVLAGIERNSTTPAVGGSLAASSAVAP